MCIVRELAGIECVAVTDGVSDIWQVTVNMQHNLDWCYYPHTLRGGSRVGGGGGG